MAHSKTFDKKFLLIYDEETKKVISNKAHSINSKVWTNKICFGADTEKEIEDKIKELGLIKQQKQR